MLGLKFRRQQVIDGLIVDFYCDELRLVIEIDGPVHKLPERSEYDLARARYLETHGLRVIRLVNDEVSEERLRQVLDAFISFPLSLRERGTGG